MANRINENRKRMVLAMEMLVRAINDEDLIDAWLMNGVPDGDIEGYSLDTNQVDDYFTDENNYGDLLDLFLRLMEKAAKNGGLYDSGVVTKKGNR